MPEKKRQAGQVEGMPNLDGNDALLLRLQPLDHPAHAEVIKAALRDPADLRTMFFACVALGVPEPMKVAETLVGYEMIEKVNASAEKQKALHLEEYALRRKLEALRAFDLDGNTLAASIFRSMQTVKGDVPRIEVLADKLREISKEGGDELERLRRIFEAVRSKVEDSIKHDATTSLGLGTDILGILDGGA